MLSPFLGLGMSASNQLVPDVGVEVGGLGVPGQRPDDFQELTHPDMQLAVSVSSMYSMVTGYLRQTGCAPAAGHSSDGRP